MGELLCRNMGPDNFEEAFLKLVYRKEEWPNSRHGETTLLELRAIKMIAARERVYKQKLCAFDPCS